MMVFYSDNNLQYKFHSTIRHYCTEDPRIQEPTFSKARLKLVLISKVGESGATCHRGKLSHSHCKSKSLIVMDFSNIHLKEIHQSVSKTSSTKFLLLCACI